jgi:hypothetical protein
MDLRGYGRSLVDRRNEQQRTKHPENRGESDEPPVHLRSRSGPALLRDSTPAVLGLARVTRRNSTGRSSWKPSWATGPARCPGNERHGAGSGRWGNQRRLNSSYGVRQNPCPTHGREAGLGARLDGRDRRGPRPYPHDRGPDSRAGRRVPCRLVGRPVSLRVRALLGVRASVGRGILAGGSRPSDWASAPRGRRGVGNLSGHDDTAPATRDRRAPHHSSVGSLTRANSRPERIPGEC